MDAERDARHLRRALTLAARGRYTTAPNPMVGAVVVAGGEEIAAGWHRRVGGAHAEVIALERAGAAARGATLYVSLEPCAHHGRTPPCADAVVRAGIARVVACHRDPQPRVAGAGFARLREAGVEVVTGLLVDRAVRLNWRFLVHQTAGRPAVTLKWAMSLDGRIATAAGESQWISSPAGRRWALALREEHAATLVGSGTALADDPRLDRRLGLAGAENVRVVLDRRLRLPPSARLFDVAGAVVVYTRAGAPAERRQALADRGATVVELERVDARSVLADLHGRGVDSVLVEGGGEVAAAFATAGAFDRVAALTAPLLVGGSAARGPLGGAGLGPLAGVPRLAGLEVHRPRGADDVVIIGFREECLRDLSSSVAG